MRAQTNVSTVLNVTEEGVTELHKPAECSQMPTLLYFNTCTEVQVCRWKNMESL